jgi:hypothetical protein
MEYPTGPEKKGPNWIMAQTRKRNPERIMSHPG